MRIWAYALRFMERQPRILNAYSGCVRGIAVNACHHINSSGITGRAARSGRVPATRPRGPPTLPPGGNSLECSSSHRTRSATEVSAATRCLLSAHSPAAILAATPGTQRHEHPPRTEATVGTREGFSLGHAYSMFPLSPHIFFHGRAGRRRERETTRPAAPIPKVLASQRPAGTLGGRRGHNAQSARLEVVTCTLSAGSPRSDAYAPQVEI